MSFAMAQIESRISRRNRQIVIIGPLGVLELEDGIDLEAARHNPPDKIEIPDVEAAVRTGSHGHDAQEGLGVAVGLLDAVEFPFLAISGEIIDGRGIKGFELNNGTIAFLENAWNKNQIRVVEELSDTYTFY